MSARPGAGPYALAVSLEPDDASTTLFFGQLASRMAGALRVARYGQPELAGQLAGASAVILVRALFELDPVIWFARISGVPLYYFADDNFMLLREQPGAWSAFVDRYSIGNVRARLRLFSGVLLSSPALAGFFSQHHLHQRLMLFPPVAPAAPMRRAQRRGAAGIGFFGGRHVHGVVEEFVLPAVRRLAMEQPLRLVLAGFPAPVAPSPGLTIVEQDYDVSYSRGLRKLADAAVDVLAHPSLPGLANNPHKNPHALISAHAIGAVPVVSARPPYQDLPDSGIMLQCEDSVASWYHALKGAVEPASHAEISERLGSFCESRFDGTVNRDVIEKLIGAPATAWIWPRRVIASVCLWLDFLRRGFARAAGRSPAMAAK
jgi:hypothetical protein